MTNPVNEPTVPDFISALVKHWLSLVSGSLSVPFTAYAVYSQDPNTRYTFAALAFAAIVIASYNVWARERRARVETQNELQQTVAKLGRPELTLSIVSEHGRFITIFIANNSGRPAVNVRADEISCGDVVLRLSNLPNAILPGNKIEAQVMFGQGYDAGTPYLFNCKKKNDHRFESVQLALRYTDLDAAYEWITYGRFFYNIDTKLFEWEKQWIEKGIRSATPTPSIVERSGA